MLDHTTLSASQEPLSRSTKDSLKNTDETPIVVSDLSASIDSLHKNTPRIRDTGHDKLEVASSIEMAKLSEARYSWQEKRAARFFWFVSQVRLLEQRYVLRNKDEVLQLLEKYSELNPLLLEIHKQIRLHFPDAQFFLRAITDPEAIDDFEDSNDNENLVLSIVTRFQPREALDKLKQFYKDWWLKTPDQARVKEKISFNLECV